jgi:hypothetical protein
MSISKSHQVTRDNLAGRADTRTVVKISRSDVEIDELTMRAQLQDIGHALILGHTVNGVIGTPALGSDGQQIVIGETGYGTLSPSRVVNFQNTFREYFRNTVFVNSASTDATINTATYQASFADGSALHSEIIFTNGDSEEVIEATFLSVGGTVNPALGTTTNFSDSFTRADSGTVGNSWVETESGGSTWSIDANRLKAVDSGTAVSLNITRAITTTNRTFDWSFVFNASQATALMVIELLEGATRRVDLRAKNNGKWGYINNLLTPVEVSGAGYSADTNYTHTVVVDEDAKTFNWYIDGVWRIAGIFRDATGTSDIDTIRFTTATGDVGTFYFDDVAINSGEVLSLSLSGNNGVTWNGATIGSAITFSTPGTALKYKIDAVGTATIGTTDTSNYDFPLKISYKTRK